METRNCSEIFAVFSEYLNLELPPDACREIEEHLADCPPCSEIVESLRATVDLCKQYKPGTMPAPLANGVRAQLREAYQQILERGSEALE